MVILKSDLKLYFILLIYFRPASYIVGPSITTILNYLSLLLMLLQIIKATVGALGKRYKPSRTCILLVLLFFWVLIGSTTYNYFSGATVDYDNAIHFLSDAIGFVLFLDMQIQKNAKRCIKAYVLIGTVICSINALTMVFFHRTGGLASYIGNNRYFLGLDNASFYWSWPVMIVDWIYYFIYSKDKRTFRYVLSYTLLNVFSYVWVWSVTAMTGTVATIIMLILYYRKAKKGEYKDRSFLYRTIGRFNCYWISALIFNYLMTYQRLHEKFGFFIEYYINKASTLSGRSRIWWRAINYINESMITGYGQESSIMTISKILINHTHNILLETLYRGGIIAGCLFVLLFLHIGKISKAVNNGAYHLLLVSIMVLLFAMTFDFAFYRYAYLIVFILAEHIELFPVKK